MQSDTIREAVARLLEEHPPEGDFPDPRKTAKDMRIRVTERDLGALKGFYYLLKGEPIIVLSSELSEQSAKIVCAHELGHHVLHRQFTRDAMFGDYDLYLSEIRLEEEANLFAAEFLIPDAVLQNALDSTADTGVTIEELADRCHTSPALLAIRLGCSERPMVFPDHEETAISD